MRRGCWLGLLGVLLAACGNDASPEAENYGNLLDSPAGLVLVASEHPTGWSRPDCFVCHEIRSIHIVNRTGIEDLDLAEIRSIVRNQGTASCSACHGDNGVVP